MTIALELATRPGWHTYWQNPGDAGAPTEIKWTLPPSWHAGAIQWPAPQAEAVGPLMDYGYEGKPWLLVDVSAPRDAPPAAVTLKAQASWLVCAEVCVPEDATVSLPLNVGDASLPPDPDFAAARARLPVVSPWPMRYGAGATLDLFVQAATARPRRIPPRPEFFPLKPGMVNGIAPQRLGFAGNGIVLAPAEEQEDEGRRARRRARAHLFRRLDAGVAGERDAGPGAGCGFRRRWRGHRTVARARFRVSRRADPEPDAVRAADPGDEGRWRLPRMAAAGGTRRAKGSLTAPARS